MELPVLESMTNVESRKDPIEPGKPTDEADLERRECSSPPCYLHEFERQTTPAAQTPKPAEGDR